MQTLIPPGDSCPAAEQWVYAGFWRRTTASLLDMLFGAIFGVVFVIAGILIFGTKALNESSLTAPIEVFLVIAAVLWFWHVKGGTPGKLLMGLQIVDATTGEYITVLRGVARYVGSIISGLSFGLGCFWMCWDDKKQTWHDKIANSVVLHKV